ncbi:MAG: PA2779 family protein [Actinomycetota bacterium]
MHFVLRQSVRTPVALFLMTCFIVPTGLLAQTHVVSPADLQQQLVMASQVREHNLQTVQNFLSTPTAEKALKSSHINPRQVRTAISTLNDRELAELAARADKAQAEFAAGNLTDHDLVLIILGIAVLILIIVAVR